MKIIYEGDTAKFPIEIQTSGEIVDPTNDSLLKWVKVAVYSRTDATNIVGKYSHGPVSGDEWTPLVVSTPGEGTPQLYLVLSKADTSKVVNEELVMQITTCLVDSMFPNSEDISTGTAVFCKVKKRID